MPTRDRLIEAASAVFAEQGFGGANITDIAARAGISGPAVYKHFEGKVDLLIEAARHSLDEVSGRTARADRSPTETARRWLSPEFATTRRLVLELHLAAGRDDELLALLSDWHREQASAWLDVRDDRVEQVTAFYLLLLGLAQIDVLGGLASDPIAVADHVDRMVGALFAESHPPPDRS